MLRARLLFARRIFINNVSSIDKSLYWITKFLLTKFLTNAFVFDKNLVLTLSLKT